MPQQAYTIGRRRIALLCEGNFDPDNAKTATGVIIWRPEEVVAVIDSKTAGKTVDRLLGFGKGIPIVKSVAEAARLGADELIIGVANVGGVLPPGFRRIIGKAICSGMNVTSGLHEMLGEDPALAALAKKHKVRIRDLREVPSVRCGWNRARTLANRRVLAIGSDCNAGKMCTALTLTREFRSRGCDAKFLATGQTGIMISGDGLCIDRAISDFASGVAEKLVMDSAAHDWLFVEGQGSLDSPSYSGVALSLLHGTAPQALVLCHMLDPRRRHDDGSALLPLSETIRLNEMMSACILPAKVVGVSVITSGMKEAAARRALRKLEDELGLPVTDSLRFGVANLADALIAFYRKHPPRAVT